MYYILEMTNTTEVSTGDDAVLEIFSAGITAIALVAFLVSSLLSAVYLYYKRQALHSDNMIV